VYKDRILVWAKLERIKGIDTVFQAARILSEYEFDVVFVGDDKEHYKAIKPPNVRLVPRIDPSDVPEFINRYPMVMGQFVVGSLGQSELEAMSCGKPVIAYWNRKYDIFYDTPCPVMSSREPEHIANLVRASTGNEHIGSLNRQWILKTHSVQRVIAKLAKIYEVIIEKRRHPCSNAK
jgi:glycosyltransferase involved in cell wall biosynthesis